MLELADLERMIAIGDPRLGQSLCDYLDQDDPDPGRPETNPNSYDDDDDDPLAPAYPEPPDNAFDLDKLRAAVAPAALAKRTPTERKQTRVDAFADPSPWLPPRLKLGGILIALYERGDDFGRAALLDVFRRGKMQWGIWQAAKAIFKRAEAAHDIAMFGVLAYRFDQIGSHASREIGAGTLLYLRRRAWRALRKIGTALPHVFPAFAVEVLRHYDGDMRRNASSWVAAQIFQRGHLAGARGSAAFAFRGVDARAFPDAWKLSPAPLLRLLDCAENDTVVEFAVACLRADHPLALRTVEPAWLARLGARRVGAIDAFVAQLVRENPELHLSKLRALGLHDTVLGFLTSKSAAARTFAIEYAQAHAPDLTAEELIELLRFSDHDIDDTKKFADARLQAMPPAQIGLANLVRALVHHEDAKWAADRIVANFDPRDISPELFFEAAQGEGDAFDDVLEVFKKKNVAVPTALWKSLIDRPEYAQSSWSTRQILGTALADLGTRPARELGIAWIQRSLEVKLRQDAVVAWLDNGMLTGPDLDVAWLKRLVGRSQLRPVALRLLGDRRRVTPAAIGLPWLLELARSPEPELAQFAQRMLLESFEPADFSTDGDAAKGVAQLWELATGAKQKEGVRAFAQSYLKAHHPELGPRTAEAKQLGIKPKLAPSDYPLAVVRPLFDDDRVDVRRLAVAIGGEEVGRWGDAGLVYALAGSRFPEPRRLGAELLLGLLVAEPAPKIPAAWIDGARIFQLAEGAHKASREVALTLIRRMYDRVGGAERLAWLMESPERDVRLFAVRLFWDRHRPTGLPAGWTPRKQVAGAPVGTQRFADIPALQQFARVVLFGLPPGRVGERDPIVEGGPRPERALPASIAKRRLIEAMRDVGLEDVELAKAIAPVLREFTHSTAKGEWQASVQALAQLRATHGEAFV